MSRIVIVITICIHIHVYIYVCYMLCMCGMYGVSFVKGLSQWVLGYRILELA
jgi:hypothetical protein